PKIANEIGKIQIGRKKVVVDVEDGIENTTSGPAVAFQVNPQAAARAGFTPEEVATDAEAVLEGAPATTPVIAHERLYTLRVWFPESNRSPLEAMRSTLLTSASG